ncbi:MAG TPA: UvrD-helicase domain-containing protein [Spirochaetota bacterium]|nr:UvrD-helicase domain-containing protein [Spirochaetota bacterium]
MKFIADFHIHSHFSMATSSKLTPEHLEYWARLKGINVIGTGDCIHPGWQQELSQKLYPADNGLFVLKDEYKLPESRALKGDFIPHEVYFMLTGEISSIYKKDGLVRKVHNICVFPDMDSLLKVQSRLADIGNITSDGRPILGLDSRDLLEIVLNSGKRAFVIPAHIWTPWFSVLGSKSGFDSISHCYGDLADEIFAVETGLSSDPPMNWKCSFLDKFRLVSNSDAHSPEKLGREANIFDTTLSYDEIYGALKFDKGFLGTIEFFPEEGKYHLDGHRNCSVVWTPLETARHKGICPVCGKPVTKGVLYRVAELCDRDDAPDHVKKDFYSITQMPDLLAEILKQKSSSSKAVMNEYFRLINLLGSEFHILLDCDLRDISSKAGELTAEGIRRLRSGEVHLKGGFDGEFGTVRVFSEGEIDSFKYFSLFSDNANKTDRVIASKDGFDFSLRQFREIISEDKTDSEESSFVFTGLSAEQGAVLNYSGTSLVVAGPGTGKTFLMVQKIKALIEGGIIPSAICAITFSNRAALELKERIQAELKDSTVYVSTIHSLGYKIIRENYKLFGLRENFTIITEEESLVFAQKAFNMEKSQIKAFIREASLFKQGLSSQVNLQHFSYYSEFLKSRNLIDIDDLIFLIVELAKEDSNFASTLRSIFSHILVDEFQDLSPLQYDFITLLVPLEGDIFVIGDPDQSIYGFRGAGLDLFKRFKEDFSSARIFTLKRSFRCSHIILKSAGQVLGKGEYLTSAKEGTSLTVSSFSSDRSEADWIASEIERIVGGVRSFSFDSGISDGSKPHHSFGEIAVLCRGSFMFDSIVEAFVNHGIAYKVVGEKPFYEYEPYSSVIQEIRKIIIGADRDDEESKSIRDLMEIMPPVDLINHLLEKRGVVFDRFRIGYFFGNISDYDDFARYLTFHKGEDDYLPDYEAVSLMTIHAAKGLEFKSVFIPGCEDGIIPFELFGENSCDIKEEERLFYVGLTRARDNVYLSYAQSRKFKARMLKLPKSRFIDRIEKNLLNFKKIEKKSKKEDDYQPTLF